MKERKLYIDNLRVFACIMVIVIHVFTTARTDFLSHTTFEEIISKAIPSLLHFAVPVFFMITGYLFLTKDFSESLSAYLKKYVLKYVIAIFTFGYVYAIIEEIFNKNYTLTMPIAALLNTLQGKTWAHMWYLYVLVGVMLCIPILKKLLNTDEKYLKYIAVILFISSFVMPLIKNYFDIRIGFDLIIKSPYLFYTIIGYYLGKNDYSKNKLLIYITGVTTIVIITLSQIFPILISNNEYISKLSKFGNYDSIFILLLAIFIFLLFKTHVDKKTHLGSYSKYTYGIYIIHMFYINLIYKLFKFNIYGNLFFLKAIFVFIVVLIASLLTTIILKKTKIIKKLI